MPSFSDADEQLPPEAGEAEDAIGRAIHWYEEGYLDEAKNVLWAELERASQDDDVELISDVETVAQQMIAHLDGRERRPFEELYETAHSVAHPEEGFRPARASGKQTRAWCPLCRHQRLARRDPANHVLHLLLSLLTAGLWLAVWYVIANKASTQTFYCTTCGAAIAENRK